MATTSTEAVSNSTHQTYRLGQNIVNRARDKIWNDDIVATASTHPFWEPDKEFKIKVKVDQLKRKFHQSRYLQVKHLPRDVSESEIRQMLSDFPIVSVSLSCGHGSAGSAKAYLEDPEMLEEWDKDRAFLLRGQKIPVSPTLTELVLCVARYPLNYSEAHFTGLVSSYGEVKMCFLMISEKTGESKGYGFVEYASKEIAMHAKSNLDGLLISDVTLCADFIDSTHTTFESLHSKCLYVDNLPHNYRDMGEFRRKFSKIVNPPYCQIALKNGSPQNWGLVEYNTGDDAENTLVQLNGTELKDKKLKISYYIPGVRAINLYLKLLNETESNRGKGNGLLPTPPPGVFQSFKNLQKQNPIFAQSIQNIMVTEQQLGVGNVNSTGNNHQSSEDGKNKSGSNGPRKKLGPNNNKSAPSSSKNSSSDSPGSEGPPHDQQAAFLRLLSGQNPATLLHSPQMGPPFLKQPKGGGLNNGAAAVLVPPTAIGPDASGIGLAPAISTGVSAIPVISTLSDFSGGGLYPEAVKSAQAPVNLIGMNPGIDAVAAFPNSVGENGAGLSMTAAGQAALWNAAAVLPEMGEKGPHLSFARQVNPLAQRPQRLAALIPGGHALATGIIPIPTALSQVAANSVVAEPRGSPNGFPPHAWFSHPAVLESPHFSFPPAIVPATSAAETGLTSLLNQNHLLQYVGDIGSGLVNDSLNQYAGTLGSFSFYKQPYKLADGQHANGSTSDETTAKKGKGDWNGMRSDPSANNNLYQNGGTAKVSEVQNGADSDLSKVDSTHTGGWPNQVSTHSQAPPRPIGFEAQCLLSKGHLRSTQQPSYVAYSQSSDWTGSVAYGSSVAENATPVGQKRKLTRFLPSPEVSPESNYIGQHSQGIGGHYIDSWPKRKKRN